MKIAVATDGNNVAVHFGRCHEYTIFNVENDKVTGKSSVDSPPHQPGLLPSFLKERDVNIVIAGGMGMRAQNLFRDLDIQPCIGVSGNVAQVVDDYLAGKLKSGESLCSHGGGGHGDGHRNGGCGDEHGDDHGCHHD